jgi:hypothetical protein
MIATSRRIEVTRRFLLVLTAGHDGQAPLEMKAHDPVSYVGDMLAFCFQACSVEADNVRCFCFGTRGRKGRIFGTR